MELLKKITETYFVDNSGEIETAYEKAMNKYPVYTVVNKGWKLKQKKQKGVVVDEHYEVTITFELQDEEF